MSPVPAPADLPIELRTEALESILIEKGLVDSAILDRILKTMDHRAKITGLYGKRAAPPDTYAGAPNRGGEAKAQMVVRYQELIEKMYAGVIASGYGSGVAAAGDDEDDDLGAAHPTAGVVESSDPQIHGMQRAGANNAAYQAAYRSCMRRKGF